MVSELHSRATLGVSAAFWFLVMFPTALGLSCRTQPPPEKAVSPTPTAQGTVQKTPIGPPGFPPAVLGKPYPGTGIVTIINLKEGWVEIEHEEIKDLMPAMQMEFWIRNPSLLKGIRVGDKVDFVVVEDRVGQYLTELKRVAPGS